MSVSEINWRTARPTIRERSKFMFNNDLFSDVKFVVQKVIGESEDRQVIPAHKLVLSIGSPVFEAMFYGELAETTDSIELPDCEYDSLLELFRYMYSDEVDLNGRNVMGVLYLAKKYMVPSLAAKCTECLQDNLDPANVFSILPLAQKYEEKTLVDQCWKVIDEQTEEAVKSDGFATIQRSLLEAVVKRDSLNIPEVNLFKAVDFWATKKCEKQGLAANGTTKRKVLGEKIVKEIRFPTMKQEDFALVAVESKMLTAEEIVGVIKRINSVLCYPVEFPETKRSGFVGEIQRCCRFGYVSHNGWSYGSARDCVIFSADRDIALHGVRLFGRENSSYWVDLEIKNATNKAVLMSKAGWFSSEILRSKIGHYYGFEVLFDSALVLKRNTAYFIEALITGSNSLRGENGHSSIKCSGVTITFTSSKYSGNGTSTKQGQFPEILFTT